MEIFLSLKQNKYKATMINGTPLEDILARQSDVTVSTKSHRSAEYTGFFVNVLSGVALSCFFLWSFVPDTIYINYLNFDYLPDKYWATAIPAYSLVLMLYIYIALALYNTEIKTLLLHDIRNFIDENSVNPGSGLDSYEDRMNEMIKYVHQSPSAVWDLPVTLCNEVLYLNDDDYANDNDDNDDLNDEVD